MKEGFDWLECNNEMVVLTHTNPIVDKAMKLIIEAFKNRDNSNIKHTAVIVNDTGERRPVVTIDLDWMCQELGITNKWDFLINIVDGIAEIGNQRYEYYTNDEVKYCSQLFVIGSEYYLDTGEGSIEVEIINSSYFRYILG